MKGSSDQFPGGGFQIFRIETDERELRAVMGSGKADGAANNITPGMRHPGGLMDVAVKRQQRLTDFDKPPDSYTAEMGVDRDMIDHFWL